MEPHRNTRKRVRFADNSPTLDDGPTSLETAEPPPKRHAPSHGRPSKSVGGTEQRIPTASSSRDQIRPVPKVSAMDLLRRLKISDNGPIAAVIQPTLSKTASPCVIDHATAPKAASSTSTLMDPIAGPSTPRMPPSILPRTPSDHNMADWSEHWVLGRKQYQEAQVKADRSLPSVIEEDAPRFLITKAELEGFHEYITARYEFRTADEYRDIVRALRNTRAIEADNAIRRCEDIMKIQKLLDDCRDTTDDLLAHLQWL